MHPGDGRQPSTMLQPKRNQIAIPSLMPFNNLHSKIPGAVKLNISSTQDRAVPTSFFPPTQQGLVRAF